MLLRLSLFKFLKVRIVQILHFARIQELEIEGAHEWYLQVPNSECGIRKHVCIPLLQAMLFHNTVNVVIPGI